ncbi:MAG TPA: bL17 family ribosomal protein [Ktedonobacterales bacterium]
MRHRIAGNRINMPEERRRVVVRNLIDGLFVYEHVTTTLARAKAIQGEAEELITKAVRGHKDAMAHLKAVVTDDYIAEQVLALARKGRFSLDEEILSDDERKARNMYPITAQGRKFLEDKLAARKKELLSLIKDPQEAQAALTAAREAMAIEVHARRTILKHLPREVTVRKIFEIFVPRYLSRPGGYTRISKIGRRQGDGAEVARLEMVQQ